VALTCGCRSFYKHLRNPLNNSADANVDGSVTPVKFEYTSENRYSFIYRLIVYVEDAGIRAALYGGISALTNGIKVEVIEADGTTVKLDLLDSDTVNSNGEWASVCYDVAFHTFPSGHDAMAVRWTFPRAGSPLILGPGEIFRVTIQDNLTALTKQHFFVEGQYDRIRENGGF